MSHFLRPLLLAAAAVASSAHAGTVTVTFVDPNRYSDIGINENSRTQALDDLRKQFELLSRRLPENATLRVDVLDVDLSGKPLLPASLRSRNDVRVQRAIDWPRMHLRYTLELDGVQRRSGDEWIKEQKHSELAYRPMDAERRMLAQWFERSVAGDVLARR